jgi:hypothetical protein
MFHITQMSAIVGVITGILTILGFVGGLVLYLFRKIVIEPLKKSIDSLNSTIDGFKLTAEKRMEKIEARVDELEDRQTRHDEQIKTLFNNQDSREKFVSS